VSARPQATRGWGACEGRVRRNPDKGSCLYCGGIGVLEATDFFCGAGGSSNGLEFVSCPACGRQLIKVTQAINHWDLAVQAHNANFPDADHDVHAVARIHPRRFRRTPIAWFSPECTHHAYCRGQKADDEAAKRSRATFEDIVRWTEYHRYDAVLVENVVEARLWCDVPGHSRKCSCGRDFDRWFAAMCELGYEGQIVYFNSQFALPTPQSRDRMYVVFWRKGARRPNLEFRPVSWCSACEDVVRGIQTWKKPARGSLRTQPGMYEWGRYGQQYVYRCPRPECGEPVAPAVVGARSIIDFSLPIERIGDRRYKNGKPRPLAENTRKRIKTGWENLGRRAPITCQVGGNLFERNGKARVWSIEQPLRTVTTSATTALVLPEGAGGAPAEPGLVVRAGGQSGSPRALGEPMQTITAHDRQIGLVTPAGGQDAAARSIDEPSHTVLGSERLAFVTAVGGQTGAGRNPRSVDEPVGTVVGENHAALVMQNMAHNDARDVDEPTPPVTTGGNHMLVQVNRGGGRGGKRAWETGEPTPTIAGHGELGLVEFRGEHGSVRDADEPMHTVTAQGTHHGMLVYNGVPGFVRDLADAAGTVTGRDKQALLMPYYRTGVARSVDEPAGTVTTKDREALVITDADIDDCGLRMLKWPELLRAQQMHRRPDGSPYQLTARRRNKRGKYVDLSDEIRTKLIGNAVSGPVATLLGGAVVEALR
jgi:DNA (cytosine-5)-methyltransferase 1